MPPLRGDGNLVEALEKKVREAWAAGVGYVQLREKDLSGRALACLTEALRAARGPHTESALLVNERLDVAASCGADGVHLPADSLPAAAVRRAAGSGWTVGLSCHSEAEVERAVQDGCSYVLLSPIFPTPSKPGVAPLGLEALARVCRRCSVPVFALGGVDAANAASCVQAGAAGVAGIRLFQQAADLAALCRYLHSL